MITTKQAVKNISDVIEGIRDKMVSVADFEKSVLSGGWGIPIVPDEARIKFLVDTGMSHEDAYREAFFEKVESIFSEQKGD